MPLSTGIRGSVERLLPFLRQKTGPPRDQLLRLRPLRNPRITWDQADGGVSRLTVPGRQDKFAKAVSSWFKLTDSKAVELDEVGTFVWALCDGAHTVDSIVRALVAQFKLNRREVEVSASTYLKMLADRNYIAFYEKRGRSQ